VAGCCDARGCDQFFDAGFARRTAEGYRKRGLSKTAARIVDLAEQHGIRDATVLEIGGGVGDIQIELLKRGAASATNLELSPGYEEEARRLLAETGLTGRVQRRLHDIAADPDAVQPADVVVLNRVVCCYPDYRRLLSAAADHARRLVVFSHPPRNPVSRALIGAENLRNRLTGREFRAFTHPPAEMLAVLAEKGMRPVAPTQGRLWRVQAVAR
jgi:2-polyprenyl-3-methyl-5-hydroxy-6-metoxy-1,4-benzoquinol methylase